jgi:hypothetical protein
MRRRRIHACHMRRRIEPHIIIHDLSMRRRRILNM